MAEFDWSKYKSSEPTPTTGFDWSKYKKVGPEETSSTESLVRGAAQGATFGLSDEATALAESAFTPKTYEQSLQESRANYQKAEEDNPLTYGAGELGAGIGTMFIPGAGVLNAGKGAKAIEILGKGAVAGGLGGFGYSEGKNLKEVATDTATGALMGVGGGALGIAAPKVVKAVSNQMPSLGTRLADMAERRAVKALNPNLSATQKLEEAGILNSVGRELLDRNILNAVNDKGQPIKFLPATIKQINTSINKAVNTTGKSIGKTLSTIDDDLGYDFFNAQKVTAHIQQKLADEFLNTPYKKALSNVLEEVSYLADNGNKQSYTFSELNKWKSDLGKKIKSWGSADLADKVIAQRYYSHLSDVIDSSIPEATIMGKDNSMKPIRKLLTGSAERTTPMSDSDIAKFAKETFKAKKESYGALAEASKIAKKAVAKSGTHNDLSLTGYILSGIGGTIGSVLGGGGGVLGLALGAGIRKASQEYGNTALALGLDAVANKLESNPRFLERYGKLFDDAYRKAGPAGARLVHESLIKGDSDYKKEIKGN